MQNEITSHFEALATLYGDQRFNWRDEQLEREHQKQAELEQREEERRQIAYEERRKSQLPNIIDLSFERAEAEKRSKEQQKEFIDDLSNTLMRKGVIGGLILDSLRKK